jgi:hypothetical protein
MSIDPVWRRHLRAEHAEHHRCPGDSAEAAADRPAEQGIHPHEPEYAYGQLGTAIDDLVAKIKSFTVTSAGSSRVGTSADNSVFTATATSSAVISQYDVSVDRLATATRATSTNSMGAPVTASDTSKTLQALNLPGSVTAGQISAIVDGVIVHYTVGDPTTTTLAQVMDGFGQAIQDQLRAAGPSSSPGCHRDILRGGQQAPAGRHRCRRRLALASRSVPRVTPATPWGCSASPTSRPLARPTRP